MKDVVSIRSETEALQVESLKKDERNFFSSRGHGSFEIKKSGNHGNIGLPGNNKLTMYSRLGSSCSKRKSTDYSDS